MLVSMQMGMAARAVMLALAAVLALVPSGCGGAQARPPVSLRVPAVDGGEIDIARYRGKPVVIHIFTTWSLAAQQDVAQLIQAHEQHGQRVTFVGIALDPDGHRLVAPWRQASGVPYLVGIGTEAVIQGSPGLERITEVPATIILNAQGRVVQRVYRGLQPGELERLLGELLAGRQ